MITRNFPDASNLEAICRSCVNQANVTGDAVVFTFMGVSIAVNPGWKAEQAMQQYYWCRQATLEWKAERGKAVGA